MKRKLNTIFHKKNLNLVVEEEWSVTLLESCFRITISANRTGDCGKVTLKIQPDNSEGYEILIDYRLDVGNDSKYIERDKWRDAEELISIDSEALEFDLSLGVNVQEILAPQDLSLPSSYRNFHVLTSEFDFYVNAGQLKALGGKLFKDWYDRECLGEDTVVIQTMDAKELQVLLNACCAYSTPIIHRRNVQQVLESVEELRITGLLRCIEMFFIQSEAMHKIRKLEIAAEFRMARLADVVLRSFNSKLERINSLYGYLAENKESLHDVHPEVLDMLEISGNHIVL